MFIKIVTVALMVFVIAWSEADQVWDGLTATWAENPENGFFTMPQNVQDAERGGWTEISGIGETVNQTSLGYYGDPRIVLLFSKCDGKVFGIQVGIPVADFENVDPPVPINYDNNPAFTRKRLNGEEYFTATAHFRQDSRTNTRRIWLHVNNKFIEYSTKADQIPVQGPYYLKKCVTWMGLHYYQINSTTSCADIFPWALLRVNDNIIGIVVQAIGKPSSASRRTWFETIPPKQIAYTIPDAPSCIGQNFAKHGYTSFHLWFKKDPLTVNCRNQCEAMISPNRGYDPSRYDTSNTQPYTGSDNVCPV